MIVAIGGQPLRPDVFDLLFEEFLRFIVLAEVLELFEVEQATLLLVHDIKELFDICKVDLYAVLFEHLLQFLCIKRPRAVVIELEKHIFNVILSLKLGFGLDVKIFRCLPMSGE